MYNIFQWELDKLQDWDTNKIKNAIWKNVDCGQPIESCISLGALRQELLNRGESSEGYHNT